MTRRQQLGLRAEKKEDTKNGKGRGRGRGRGRVGKKGLDNIEPGQPKEAPESAENVSGNDLKPRCLFGDGDTSTAPACVVPVGPQEKEKKPDPKPVKKTKRAPTATPEKPKTTGETDAAPVPSPAVKQPKKRSRKKQAEATSMAAEPSASTQTAVPVAVAEPLQNRIPSERAYKQAMDYLIRARKDSAHWFYALRLWKALDGSITKDTPNMKKFEHWGFSMYWGSFRCGLLQKREKKSMHTVSYGGGFCRDIGLPLEAAYMYVPPSAESLVSTTFEKTKHAAEFQLLSPKGSYVNLSFLIPPCMTRIISLGFCYIEPIGRYR